MLPAAVTRPNDGEFTVVSITMNCGVLKTLVACARTSNMRASPRAIILVKAMSNRMVGGPMMVFLPASPN